MEKEGFHQLSRTGAYWLGDTLSLVDLTFYPWFERLIALEHYRNFKLPVNCTRLKEWLDVMQHYPSVRATAQPLEVYIQDYARYASNQESGATAAEMRCY
jgi:glutathione S-transferase